MGQMLDRIMYGHRDFIALNLFSNVANFNLEWFFNIQLYTETMEKFIHTEKNLKIKFIFDFCNNQCKIKIKVLLILLSPQQNISL
jgi:hypothetical protein